MESGKLKSKTESAIPVQPEAFWLRSLVIEARELPYCVFYIRDPDRMRTHVKDMHTVSLYACGDQGVTLFAGGGIPVCN